VHSVQQGLDSVLKVHFVRFLLFLKACELTSLLWFVIWFPGYQQPHLMSLVVTGEHLLLYTILQSSNCEVHWEHWKLQVKCINMSVSMSVSLLISNNFYSYFLTQLFTSSQYCGMYTWWIICLQLHCTLLAEYASEKILKFCQYLTKIWTCLWYRQFIDLRCSVPNFEPLLCKNAASPRCSSWVFMNSYMCCIRKTPAAIPPNG